MKYFYSENSEYYLELKYDGIIELWTLFLTKKRKSKFLQKFIGGVHIKIIEDFKNQPSDDEIKEISKTELDKLK